MKPLGDLDLVGGVQPEVRDIDSASCPPVR